MRPPRSALVPLSDKGKLMFLGARRGNRGVERRLSQPSFLKGETKKLDPGAKREEQKGTARDDDSGRKEKEKKANQYEMDE